MKILWITNALLPEAISKLIGEKDEIKGTGSWVQALADALKERNNFEITIAAISDLVKELTFVQGELISYYAIPRGKGDCLYNNDYETAYREINAMACPDLVHIHGSEYPHSLAALRAFGAEKTIVSLQGLVSIIARYNRGSISVVEALLNMTFHDILRGGMIRNQQRMFRSGKYEQQLLSEARFVIGRTSFDKQHTWAINPKIKYFHVEEALRKEFYDSESWDYSKCTPHTIFMSQAAFPIKGLNKVVEALGIVVQHYPNVKLRIAGQDLTYFSGSFKDKMRITGFGRIVKKIIKKNKLTDKVFFTGRLNAEEMIKEYLQANVYICASCIENSPNSLAEAQILGVPCIASYAGGIPDMMKGDEEHLYRFDDVEMMAFKICNIFGKEGNINTIASQQMAAIRHNKKRIIDELINIYKEVAK